MTVLYRSGLMLTPPVALAGHAFTRTNHPGQWRCLRCNTLTHDIHHTTLTGTCTGLAAAITTGAPMTTTAEPTIPIRLTLDVTFTITDTFDIPISSILDEVRRQVEKFQRRPEDEVWRSAPSWLTIVDELACHFETHDGWTPRLSTADEYSIDCVEWDEAAPDHVAVRDLISAELDRLADENDPERARLRPSVGQLDIFGNEVTP